MDSLVHFLRPELLLLLLLIPILLLLMRRSVTLENTWAQHINPALLSALQGHSGQKKHSGGSGIIVALLAALLIVAASGPSWHERAQPVTKVVDNIVVVLDLSLSMLAEDTPPSRLVRAKQKIVDLLGYRTEGSTALIAFSGDSFVVTPLTDDTRTIESNLAALGPLLMPVIGSRADLAITQAIEVFENSKLNSGRIVLVTDGVAAHQATSITEQLSRTKFDLNIISVGTESGAPILMPNNRGYLQDNGAIVIPKTDVAALKQLAFDNSGEFSELTLSDEDLNALSLKELKSFTSQDNQDGVIEEELMSFDQWEDMGFIFLAVALPLCLIAYRQGVLLLLFIMILPESGSAFELQDLWKTKDQQASEKQQAGDFEGAAELYASEKHRAEALYRSGEYEQAAGLYKKHPDATSSFNKGNSLAKANKLDEAIQAYEEALALDPTLEDAAFNKKLVEELKQKHSQQNQSNDQDTGKNGEQGQQDQNQSSDSQNDSENSNNSESDDQGEQQNNSDSNEEQSSAENDRSSQEQSQSGQSDNNENRRGDSEQSPNPPTPQSAEDIVQRNEEQKQQFEQAQQNVEQEQNSPSDGTPNGLSESDLEPLDNQDKEQLNDGSMAIEGDLSSEEQQSYEQWMRRVPDDPSGLLRRKFEQQSRQRGRESNPEEPLW